MNRIRSPTQPVAIERKKCSTATRCGAREMNCIRPLTTINANCLGVNIFPPLMQVRKRDVVSLSTTIAPNETKWFEETEPKRLELRLPCVRLCVHRHPPRVSLSAWYRVSNEQDTEVDFCRWEDNIRVSNSRLTWVRVSFWFLLCCFARVELIFDITPTPKTFWAVTHILIKKEYLRT